MRILLLHEDTPMRRSLRERLAAAYPEARLIETDSAGLARSLQDGPYGAAIVDELGSLPDMAVLAALKADDPHTAVVLHAPSADAETVAAAMRGGLDDFSGSLEPADIVAVLRGALSRSHAARSRAESHRRDRDVIERVPVGLYQTVSSGTITQANPALARLVGLSRVEEVVGRNAVEFYADPADRERFVGLLGREGVVRGYEFLLKRVDGSVLWVENNGRAVLGPHGEISRFEGTLEDISDRRRSEVELREAMTALRESEERFRRLAENAKDVIYRYRYLPERGYEYLSPSVEAMLGHTPSEHYADPDYALRVVHPDDRGLIESMRRDPEGSGGRGWTIRWLHRDGRVITTEERNTPVYDEQGRLIAVEGVVRDVTEQRAAEEANRRLSQAIEQSGEGVVMTDAERRITYVNRAVEEMSGYSGDELLGTTPDVFASEPEFGGRMQDISEALQRGEVWRGELKGRHKSGEINYVQATVAGVRGGAGTPVGFVVTLRDVTKERLLEEQLRHSQKMEAIGQLAGGIAHDFNNLLTVIRGSTDLLLSSLVDADERRADLLEIKRSADRAAELTRRLLAFSRRQVMQTVDVDLNAVVAGMEIMVSRLVAETIEVRIDLHPGLGLVRADPAQIEQAVMNLIVNSRDAMPEGGRLLVRTRPARVGDLPVTPDAAGDEWGLIEVVDTGLGMDGEMVGRVFEPFFTTKETGKGTGLGLPMVYGIVKQSGGEVFVESNPGTGTTVTLAFPIAVADPREAPGDGERHGEANGRETVLLVDDEPTIRRLASRVLADHGFDVHEAAAGWEALELAGRLDRAVDLLVTDLTMPGMDGRSLARRLVAQQGDMRVVFMSGYSQANGEEDDIGAEHIAFIEKPFEPRRLAKTVRDLLDA